MFRPITALSCKRQPLRSKCLFLRAACEETVNVSVTNPRKKAVVIGSGFAGLGAAWSLSKAGADVTLLDAAAQPGGLSAVMKTPQGRLFEPGIKGFWYQYCNITRLVTEELGQREDDVFTPYTESGFYTRDGLQVRAPVLQDKPRLPAPFGNLLYTSSLFTSLPLADRLSALPLLGALLEYASDACVYEQYDKMSALELFSSAGMSQRLYKDFLEPMLLVTLFAPGEQLSAAAALDALYYFVLAHQPDFDVRWCRGAVGERVTGPMAQRLQEQGVALMGGRRVVGMEPKEEQDGEKDTAHGQGRAGSSGYRVRTQTHDGQAEEWEADSVVFAVGIKAMQGIVRSSPLLASVPSFASIMDLSTLDVMAVRLWLDKRLNLPFASNVLAGIDPRVGATVFDLSVLQDQYKDEPGSVIELDFYNASCLLPLPDDAIIQRCLEQYLAVINPESSSARVIDACVSRFPGAVSAFTPGSAAALPSTTSPLSGVFMAGDLVAQGPGTHGAKGLCQEKAYVTGLQAGNLAAGHMGLGAGELVLPAEADESHIRQAKQAAATARMLGDALLRVPGVLGLPLPLRS